MIPASDQTADLLRLYDPGTLQVMGAAFDKACQFLPPEHRNSASARRKLALRIIHVTDKGERDPVKLADLAVLSISS